MGRKCLIDDKISSRIKDMYLTDKKSALQISKVLNLNVQTIINHIKKMGWDNIEMKLTDDEKQIIISHIKQGHSIYTIRDLEGLSINTIKQYLDSLDIDIDINQRDENSINGKEIRDKVELEEQLSEYYYDDDFILNYISTHGIDSIRSKAIEMYTKLENVEVKVGSHKDSSTNIITNREVNKTHTLTKIKTYLEFVKNRYTFSLCDKLSNVIQTEVSKWRKDYCKRHDVKYADWNIHTIIKLPTIEFDGVKVDGKWVKKPSIDMFSKEFDVFVENLNKGVDLPYLLGDSQPSYKKTTVNYMWEITKSDITALCEIFDYYMNVHIVDVDEVNMDEWEEMIFKCNSRIDTKIIDLGEGVKGYKLYGRQSINKTKRYRIDNNTAKMYGLKPNAIYHSTDDIKEKMKIDDDELNLLVAMGKICEIDESNRKIRE